MGSFPLTLSSIVAGMRSADGDVRRRVFETLVTIYWKPVYKYSEAIENIPAGWKARETYQVVSPDEFVEIFELAMGDKPYELYSKTRFKRARR